MDNSSLAFFQNFYTDATLYLVADAAPAAEVRPAAEGQPVAAAVPPPAAAPARAAAPVPVEAPPAVAAALGKLPSLAGLPPVPTVAPTAPVAQPVAATPAAPAPVPVAPAVAPPAFPASAPTAAPAAASPLANTPYSTLGDNPNGLIILVRMDPDRFRKLPRNVFLNNLLKAIRLIMEDVVLINVESHLPVSLTTLRQVLAARQVIGFGKNLLDVAVRTTQIYEPVLLVGDLAYLPAAEIELIEYDTSLKKRLWQGMQAMFLA
ncbi:hypothetical protein LJY25_07160 [Hymenobacter sp. BT175]|uniref:hypothetical protein n=1 Tax=Hymenobacter translucens TaxID=2886507 RepID=UPI001D0EF01E|nr:hypothetical protein [Hymenobacter translucens]MCC2546218.1 hypothetical protein [Hymenobacter translucens]